MSATAEERAVDVRVVDAIETWFAEVRAPRRESEHTTAAYRSDLRALLEVLARQLGQEIDTLEVRAIAPLSVMRRAFGEWAANGPNGKPRAASSIKRAHSTWSVFFEYLVSEELVPGSPMPGVGKPKRPVRQPKPFTPSAVTRIVDTVQAGGVERRDPWPELDQALVLVDLTTGARTAELLALNVEDVNRSPGSEGLRLLGKGGRERTAPVERIVLDVIERYLESRRARFPDSARKRGMPANATAWDWWPPGTPLFVDRRGERMKRGALAYAITLIYRSAGVEPERARGALTHAMRHTAATRVAETGATVVELMLLFGWESLGTPQNYIEATAREVRQAARANPIYEQLGAEEDATK